MEMINKKTLDRSLLPFAALKVRNQTDWWLCLDCSILIYTFLIFKYFLKNVWLIKELFKHVTNINVTCFTSRTNLQHFFLRNQKVSRLSKANTLRIKDEPRKAVIANWDNLKKSSLWRSQFISLDNNIRSQRKTWFR